MSISFFLLYAIYAIILSLPRASAQVSSAFSCYTVHDQGPSPKSDFSTYFQATTNTIFSTKVETLTTTVTGQVPDSTVTVHKKAYQTEWHDEYTDTYSSVIWSTRTESLGRPTITITLPDGVPIPSETSTSDDLIKRQDDYWTYGEHGSQEGDEQQEEEMEEYVGEVVRPEPEQRPTKVNTVICNTEFFTTSVETQMAMYIVNRGVPKRTITLTVTHTEVVDMFATPPATTVTYYGTTKYQTYTTYFQIVTPTSSTGPFGYVPAYG